MVNFTMIPIGFSQPGTWYEAHITTQMELYGCYHSWHAISAGHTREYAYGLTMFENDDIDLYQKK
jgi:penicillin amidase